MNILEEVKDAKTIGTDMSADPDGFCIFHFL